MKNILKKSLILSFYEMKARNQNTYLGFFWYFLQPLLMFSVLYQVRKNMIGLHDEDFVPYLFVGVILVHFFISGTNMMLESITKNYELLNSRKIDPEIFIYSKFFVSLWQHLFEVVFVAVTLTFLGYYHAFLYLIIVPIFGLFMLGVGKIICVASTKVFDVTYLWKYLGQLLWFILPIYYLADKENFLIKYNPISYFLDLARQLTYDIHSKTFGTFVVCVFVAIISFVIGSLIFKNQRNIISERIK